MGMAIFQERSPMSFQYPRPLPVSWGWKRPPLIITNTSCRSRSSGRAGSKASELLSVDQGNVTEVIQSLLLVSQQKTLAPPVTQSVSVCWQSIESMCVLKQVPAKATAWLMIYHRKILSVLHKKDNLAGMSSLDSFQQIIHNLLSNCAPKIHVWQRQPSKARFQSDHKRP